jgi:intergrase/recombinase
LKKYLGNNADRRTVTRYAIRHSLLAPKHMRKVSWRIMIKVMPREVVRFIQSIFGELKISEAGYEHLLSEADKLHPWCLDHLQKVLHVQKS